MLYVFMSNYQSHLKDLLIIFIFSIVYIHQTQGLKPLQSTHLFHIFNDIISEIAIILFKMQLDANQTFVSIQETQIIAVSNNSRKIDPLKCKICHQAAIPDKQLQCFCSCKQKFAYAHATCMRSYMQNKINKALEIDINEQAATVCQKCEQVYKIQYEIVRKCSDFKRFKKNVQRKGFLFGICIIGTILSIITLAVCSSILKKINYNQKSTLPTNEREIVICFIIFSSLLLVLFFYKIMQKFLTFRQAKVDI